MARRTAAATKTEEPAETPDAPEGEASANGETKRTRKAAEPVRIFHAVNLQETTLTDAEGNEVTAFVQVPDPAEGEELPEDAFTVFSETESDIQGQGLVQCKAALRDHLSNAMTAGDDDAVAEFAGKTIGFLRIFEMARPRVRAAVTY